MNGTTIATDRISSKVNPKASRPHHNLHRSVVKCDKETIYFLFQEAQLSPKFSSTSSENCVLFNILVLNPLFSKMQLS